MILQTEVKNNYRLAERLLFKLMREYRISPRKEFFKCDTKTTVKYFNQVQKIFAERGILDIMREYNVYNEGDRIDACKFISKITGKNMIEERLKS